MGDLVRKLIELEGIQPMASWTIVSDLAIAAKSEEDAVRCSVLLWYEFITNPY